MACDDLRAALQALQKKYADLEQSITDLPPQEQATARKQAQPQLNKINAQIVSAAAALNKCLAALKPPLPQKVPGAQPAEILQIQFQNPAFEGTGAWGATVGNGKFPLHQGFEWKQVINSAQEYDTDPVGVTGWAAYQDIASKDSPGLHPFGNDWEFSCALDAQYLSLCPDENIEPAGGTKIANDLNALGIPQDVIQNAVQRGFLGIECDSGLVPQTFQDEFNDGDRVAVFGRWIVDCGEDFHTEIHPPLLMASASVYKQPPATHVTALQVGPQFTRALFTSRPYLVGQTFANGTHTTQIYDDSSGDDGHFFGHFVNEVRKAEEPFGGSLLVEGHPKIKQYPFQGLHVFQFVVRATQANPILANQRPVVSFHFTIRSGCAVQVIPNDDFSVRVFISLNSAGYKPLALPKRNDRRFSISQLNEEGGAGFWTDLVEGIVGVLNLAADTKGFLVLSQGLQTDLYDPLPTVDFRDSTATNAVIQAPLNAIPAGKGISQDDSQPYPVVGWLEVGWAGTQVVIDPMGSISMQENPV